MNKRKSKDSGAYRVEVKRVGEKILDALQEESVLVGMDALMSVIQIIYLDAERAEREVLRGGLEILVPGKLDAIDARDSTKQ